MRGVRSAVIGGRPPLVVHFAYSRRGQQKTIIDVRPGTPAANAGLAKGDVIVSVNGSSGLLLRQVRELFSAEPGTVEHLMIKSKDGATPDIDLTLEDYV
jgi:C-terminal processing protease CtpA/Prc